MAMPCLLGGVTTVASGQTASISRIEVSPRVLDTTAGDEVRIRFHHSASGLVVVDVIDENSEPVWSRRESFGHGYGEFRWNGRTQDQRAVAGGVYTFVLTTDNGSRVAGPGHEGGSVAVYDLALNQTTGRLSYRLPEPARVEARLGVGGGGPLVRTIHALQGPGTQVVQWDGWDESRVVNLLGDATVLATVLAVSLPDNSVIVRDDNSLSSPPSEPFHIKFKQEAKRSPADRRVLIAEVRATGDVNSILRGDRYEWIFYVDHRFVFEEEREATNPYVLELDITPLSIGDHVLTVNLAGQESGVVRSFSGRFTAAR